MTIRDAEPSDQRFLACMFVDAALWDPTMPRRSLRDLLESPMLHRYFGDWGRGGDVALIAESGAEPIGAAWYRYFRAEEPGYGFVSQAMPELGIAVSAHWRGRTVGTALLEALIQRAKCNRCPGLSLSVAAANPARHLYERQGFIKVADGASTWTMILTFDS